MQQPGIDIVWNKPRKNLFCSLASECEQNLGSPKIGKLKTMREWYFTHALGHPTWTIVTNFGTWGNMVDVITVPNFVLIGFGVWEFWHPKSALLHGLSRLLSLDESFFSNYFDRLNFAWQFVSYMAVCLIEFLNSNFWNTNNLNGNVATYLSYGGIFTAYLLVKEFWKSVRFHEITAMSLMSFFLRNNVHSLIWTWLTRSGDPGFFPAVKVVSVRSFN